MRKRPGNYYDRRSALTGCAVPRRRGRRGLIVALALLVCALVLSLIVIGVIALLTPPPAPPAMPTPTPTIEPTPEPSATDPLPTTTDEDFIDEREYGGARYLPRYTEYEDLAGVDLVESSAPASGEALGQAQAEQRSHEALSHFFGAMVRQHPDFSVTLEQGDAQGWKFAFAQLYEDGSPTGVIAHVSLRADGLLISIDIELPLDLPPEDRPPA